MGCPTAECAKMLALCYPLLVSLVLAAPGVSRSCYDYCKSQESEPTNGAWPLECNCEDLIDTEFDSTETPITLDDTGVYFVPAAMHMFQEQFAPLPFYIVNPAKSLPKSRVYRINRQFGASEEAFSDPITSPSEHVEIFERTISHTSINSEKYPIYLDLEFEKSPNDERAAAQQNTLIEDVEATERALVECLDFQVLHYTRHYGFMSEFQKFWELRNLKKYEHISNSEVEEKINKYCKETESIVEHSLHEIKQALPKRHPGSRSVEKNEDTTSEIKRTTENAIEELTKHAENPSSLIITTPLSENFTRLSETNERYTENITASKTVTEIPDTTYNPMESWPFIHLTSSPAVSEIDQYSSSSTDAATDITALTTETTLIVDSPGKFRNAAYESKGVTPRDIELDLDTLGSEDVFHTQIPMITVEDKVPDMAQVRKTTPLTTPLDIEESLARESSTTEINAISSQTLIENNTMSYNSSLVSETSTYSQNRNMYAEKEVKIPKIITTECQNNIVQSAAYGTEELPNNDFTEYAQADDFKTSGGNSKPKYDIMGKLFFVAKNELVPVRFIQTDAGAISLGIDGISLCEKFVPPTSKKYNLLTALCNYMQNNMYFNKNTTII